MERSSKPRQAVSASEGRKVIPEGLWIKCPACKEITFVRELERNAKVCPYCCHHHLLTADEWVGILVEEGSFRLVQKASSVVAGVGRRGDFRVAIGVADRGLRALTVNSLYDVFAPLVERAAGRGFPLLLVCAGGSGLGSATSLSASSVRFFRALRELGQRRLPYFLVLTDPDPILGYAHPFPLGDVVLAEAMRSEPPSAASRQDTASPDAKQALVDIFVPRTELVPELERLLALLIPVGNNYGRRAS